MTTNSKNHHRTWKWRSMVSLYLLIAGIALFISGVVLYIAPSGRVANFMDWHFVGLDKGQWGMAALWHGDGLG